MKENQNLKKNLATSNRQPGFFALPQNAAHNRVQMLSNQRTHRQLSRAALEPAVTPIWQQQTFAPSPEFQQRFGRVAEKTATPTTPTMASAIPTTPNKTETPSVNEKKTARTPIPSPEQHNPLPSKTPVPPLTPPAPQLAPTLEPTATPSTVLPIPEDGPDKTLIQEIKEPKPSTTTEEKSISELLNELTTNIAPPTPKPVQTHPTVEPENPSEPHNSTTTEPQIPLPVPANQKESALPVPETKIKEEDSQLEQTLNILSDLRHQIHDHEEKLQLLKQQMPNLQQKQDQFSTEEKAKTALIKNIEHALINTQQELGELRKAPGANQQIISEMEKQLTRQKDTFAKLQHEQKQLEKNQQQLAEKVKEHETVEKELENLQEQHQSLQKDQRQETTQKEEKTDSFELDPGIRKLINQTMETKISSDKPPVKSDPHPPSPIKMPVITKEKNAINGIVTDLNNKLITEAIVIIKNSDGRPLRALKTNQLGQFWITTALENGTYYIETEKENLAFDKIEIKLAGGQVEPILIKAKS